ncbi:Phosducin/Thioredoxin, putative [Leishmania lindenbergi]|uniref:Phosducin/Thioredoxin n=1 Tax=Leishmania lindenbergi TaxID=651832 RepID=A0AAW3AB87_9TRYP
MLGSGKSSGVVNEASNLKANENLTATIEQMNSKAYRQSRDMNDVIPTHRRPVEEAVRDNGVPAYDPAAEKHAEKVERGNAADAEDDDEDAELMELRRMRLQHMRTNQEKQAEWRSKQHGEYREISQDDFFNIVVREKGGSERVCVHFYHKDFETCKVMDRYLSELSRTLLPVKFVKIDAERSPFLVERLHVTTLPHCVIFLNDVCIDRIVGFEGCATEDGALDANLLRERIVHTLKLEGDE